MPWKWQGVQWVRVELALCCVGVRVIGASPPPLLQDSPFLRLKNKKFYFLLTPHFTHHISKVQTGFPSPFRKPICQHVLGILLIFLLTSLPKSRSCREPVLLEALFLRPGPSLGCSYPTTAVRWCQKSVNLKGLRRKLLRRAVRL